MNSRQKLVQQAFLNREDVVLKRLDAVYTQAAKDCAASIKQQYAEIQLLTDAINQLPPGDPQRVILESRRQSKIYQKTYQEALQKQIDDILKNTRRKEYKTVSEYLAGCYDEGYLGAMYDLHGQGIPIITPINQQRMVHAVQLDSKISQGLYTRLGQNLTVLKRKITAQVSRCMATGITFHQCAQLLDGASGIGYYNSMRIVRTEGHRIQTTAQMDAMTDAKDNGCDVVKQWDAALDDRTRESHQMVDGEIREMDEPFSNGLMYPGDPKGSAEEVIHCRCALLQRARWALGQAELDTLKQRAAYYGLDKSKNFDDFKQKYLKAAASSDTITVENVLSKPVKSNDKYIGPLLESLEKRSVEYLPVQNHKGAFSEADIIQALAGGDRTSGSCASLGLAYIGQMQGWNILDFRDGASRQFFASSLNLFNLSKADGISALHYGDVAGKSSCTLANNFLKQCEIGKEYYLCVGRHASIVRKNDEGVLQYLELQSANRSGWTDFNRNPRYTLTNRFGCSSTSGHGEMLDFMIDITDSDFKTDDFKSLLGYINTAETEQRKGTSGTIK